MSDSTNVLIRLPDPDRAGRVSLEEALSRRRSVREFSDVPIALAEISQLCWAAQGITDEHGHRTAPSAGALYPLEVYVVVGHAEGLAPGVYQYNLRTHTLQQRAGEDRRGALHRAALKQESVRNAPVIFAVTAAYERTMGKYGQRGVRYAHIEAGHAAQNLLLQATALGMAGVSIGAFDDDDIRDVLNAPDDETPLYLLPMGRP